ncbi:acyl-CoA dehydrogenase family protein [Nocardioides humi]|uniref:Medium-chain specific acyl-CoA dehydrogenase, mitochondrial n=1 Tax=Nocardioides humi TaxID=449461 RepID=A0ABN2ABE7_9ACTN|nr:acyl-CoA dehydrogenase family protein [Nocardioides humi]
MDFSLSEEQRAITRTVRAFVERELFPWEDLLLRRGMESVVTSPGLTKDEKLLLQKKAADHGLWGVSAPEELGGADLDPFTQTLINMELGRTFISFTFGGEASPMLYRCNEQQRPDYLLPVLHGEKEMCTAISEPGGGSDVRAMRTTAVRDGDDFVLNGEKMWISRALESDFAVVFARTPEEGAGGITGFLVDRDLGWTAQHIPTMGAEQKVATMHFEDVRVPAANVLEGVNQGFDQLMRWVYDNRLFRVSARLVGAAERMLEMGTAWASQREVFGKKLADYSNWAFSLAELEIELRAARLLTLQGAWKASAGLDYRHESYVAKVHTARLANRVADEMIQLHGGMGYAMELPLERWYRDLRVIRIYEGSDEVNLASIARNLFRGNVRLGAVTD